MVKTFSQFLDEKKRLAELTQIDPQTSTSIIGSLVSPTTQQANLTQVAKNLTKKNAPLVGAILDTPEADIIKAKMDAMKKKTQPNQQAQTNVTASALAGLPGTQAS